MTIFDASGTASGSSTASSSGVVLTWASAALGGTGTLVAGIGAARVSSGRFDGESSFEWSYIQDAAGAALGTSSASATGVVAKSALGTFLGSSFFQVSVPFVFAGSASMSVLPVVDQHPPPIRAITMGPKAFSWDHAFQRGDLSVFICDATGPVVPFSVRYRFIQVRLNGSRQPVGPRDRVPVAGVAGEYYVTGRAGELGQPGEWVVEWTFQRSPYSERQLAELPYMVLDAVLSGDPSDVTCRKTKFGWN